MFIFFLYFILFFLLTNAFKQTSLKKFLLSLKLFFLMQSVNFFFCLHHWCIKNCGHVFSPQTLFFYKNRKNCAVQKKTDKLCLHFSLFFFFYTLVVIVLALNYLVFFFFVFSSLNCVIER